MPTAVLWACVRILVDLSIDYWIQKHLFHILLYEYLKPKNCRWAKAVIHRAITMRQSHFLSYHRRTFLDPYIGVGWHTGLSGVSPFLSCPDSGNNKREKQTPRSCNDGTRYFVAAGSTSEPPRSAPLANASPLEKPERWLLQLLLEMLPPCESHLYSHFRLMVQIWEDLRVFGG